jgi:hypothetical protein
MQPSPSHHTTSYTLILSSLWGPHTYWAPDIKRPAGNENDHPLLHLQRLRVSGFIPQFPHTSAWRSAYFSTRRHFTPNQKELWASSSKSAFWLFFHKAWISFESENRCRHQAAGYFLLTAHTSQAPAPRWLFRKFFSFHKKKRRFTSIYRNAGIRVCVR